MNSIPQTGSLRQLQTGDVQEVVFSTIEEYLDNRNSLSLEQNRQKISKLLLPPEVNLLYTEQAEIQKDFKQNLEKDKKAVEADIDGFLRSVIDTMDKIKEVLFKKIDN